MSGTLQWGRHALMENRDGLAVGGCVLPVSGYAERGAALELLGALESDSADLRSAPRGLRRSFLYRGFRRRVPASRSSVALLLSHLRLRHTKRFPVLLVGRQCRDTLAAKRRVICRFLRRVDRKRLQV